MAEGGVDALREIIALRCLGKLTLSCRTYCVSLKTAQGTNIGEQINLSLDRIERNLLVAYEHSSGLPTSYRNQGRLQLSFH